VQGGHKRGGNPVIETMGGTPVTMDYAEMLEATKRGMVDEVDLLLGATKAVVLYLTVLAMPSGSQCKSGYRNPDGSRYCKLAHMQ